MNILSLFSSSVLLPMLEMLLRIKASNFAAVAFMAGQFVHFRYTVDRKFFHLPFFFLKDFQTQITEDLSSQIKCTICHC